MTKPVFRLSAKVSTDDLVAEENKKQKRKGMDRFLPIELAISKARWAKSLKPRRAAALALHPDERVPIALMRNACLLSIEETWGYSPGLREALLWRAVQIAEEEELVWHPLFDAFDRTWADEWPDFNIRKTDLKGFMKDTKARAQDPFLTLLPEDEVITGKTLFWSGANQRLADASVEEKATGLQFRSYGFKRKLIEQFKATEWSAELVTECLKDGDSIGDIILAKPELVEAFTPVIRNYLIEQMKKGSPLQNCMIRAARMGMFREEASWQAIFELFQKGERYNSKDRHVRMLGWLLLGPEPISDTQWEVLKPWLFKSIELGYQGYSLHKFLNDPRITAEEVLKTLDMNATKEWRRIVAESRAASLGPVVKRLLKSQNTTLVEKLAKNLEPETFGRVFKQLADRVPETAMETLEKRSGEMIDHVERQDLAPIISKGNKDQRVRAISMAAKLGGRKNG